MPIDGKPSSHKVMQFLLAACIELKFYSSMLKSIKSILCNEGDCGMFQYLLSHDYKTKFTHSFYSKLHGLYIGETGASWYTFIFFDCIFSHFLD